MDKVPEALGGGARIHPKNARMSSRYEEQYVAQCVECAALTLVVRQYITNLFRTPDALSRLTHAGCPGGRLNGGSYHRGRGARACPPRAVNPTPHTPHPTLYTLHHIPYTLHPAPYTLHPTPYTLHPTPYTLYPTQYSPHPYTLIPNP